MASGATAAAGRDVGTRDAVQEAVEKVLGRKEMIESLREYGCKVTIHFPPRADVRNPVLVEVDGKY